MTAATGTAGAAPPAGFHSLEVAGVARLCDDAVAVTFEVPPELAGAYAFRAGQSLTLRRVDDGVDARRSYSICAPEGSPPRIGVREVEGGEFSTWLVREVRPGDRIEVGAPAGSFTPGTAGPAHHALVAAGSGITPVLSIAATVLREPGATVTLVYGNRRAGTVMFADELADLKDRYPERLEVIHVLSREQRDADVLSGRIDRAKLAELLELVPGLAGADHWWLCGPYGLVTDAAGLLAERGVPAAGVHRELFFVEDLPPEQAHHEDPAVEGPAAEVTVVLDGRATTLSLAAATPILDGAQRARPDLPFACRGGVCGTCRARLVEGEVEMRRNFALTEEELAAGFVLTCQSRPRSERVTVDYDA